ncbi:MAG: dihydropteroate synthase [Planctomycetota bacterium]|nr:dihydropteroate synthase [Planctomycetota bacterium]
MAHRPTYLDPHDGPLVMGILNATPDSFSDGGRFHGADAAIAHGRAMARDGAHWIDVGGESTRPGAPEVSVDEECQRVVPVVRALAAEGLAVSIDTRKASVAAEALAAGATMVNDVSGGRFDPRILEVAAEAGAWYCAMHSRGTPADMQAHASYGEVLAEVRAELAACLAAARAAGLARTRLLADPGIGFAKRAEHSLELLANLDGLHDLGVPLLVGVSRKSMIGALTGREAATERLAGSLAALTAAVLAGAAILRVHDVPESVDALQVADAIRRTRG